MNKILIILLLVWGAGCTQQEEMSNFDWALVQIREQQESSARKDSIIEWQHSLIVADNRWHMAQDTAKPSLYLTEYEVCQMRGHDYIRQNVHIPDEITCKWCWAAPTEDFDD